MSKDLHVPEPTPFGLSYRSDSFPASGTICGADTKRSIWGGPRGASSPPKRWDSIRGSDENLNHAAFRVCTLPHKVEAKLLLIPFQPGREIGGQNY